MPGVIELGVLLGQQGGAQSFESVGSWALIGAGTASRYLQATDVHSSAGGIRLEVYSTGGSGRFPILQYDHRQGNDAYERLN